MEAIAIDKQDDWATILIALEVYTPYKFALKHLSSIRSTISTTVKDQHPDRVYKTKKKDNDLIVERLK